MRDSVNRRKVFEIGWGSVGRTPRITGRPKLFRSEIHAEHSFGTSSYIVTSLYIGYGMPPSEFATAAQQTLP